MQAYELDDEPTIYAANSAEEAATLYLLEGEGELGCGYPRELTNDELDEPILDYDENERPTGEITTIRCWLDAATEPGYICGAMR